MSSFPSFDSFLLTFFPMRTGKPERTERQPADEKGRSISERWSTFTGNCVQWRVSSRKGRIYTGACQRDYHSKVISRITKLLLYCLVFVATSSRRSGQVSSALPVGPYTLYTSSYEQLFVE